jgi:tetratricopeptide (TPR) repeat protein
MRNIFISYRRADSSDITGRIFDWLKSNFGEEHLFKDVDSIGLGADFRQAIETAVARCDVMLAIIGKEWLLATDDTGTHRIDDPDDYVRLEIATALERGIPVIPVLVRGAAVPNAEQLPTNLQALAFRNAIEVRPDPDFHNDMERIANALSQFVERRHQSGARDSTRRSSPLIVISATVIGLGIVMALLTVFRLPSTQPKSVESVRIGTQENTVNVDMSNRMTVINNVSVIAQEYEKLQGHPLDDAALIKEIERAVAAVLAGNDEESAELFEKIAAKVPVPAIFTNLGVAYAKANKPEEAQAAFDKAIARDASYAAARKNQELLEVTRDPPTPTDPTPRLRPEPGLKAKAESGPAVQFDKSPLATVVIEPLHEQPEAVEKVHVVDSGAKLGHYSIRYSLKPQSPTVVEPGTYDVLLKMVGGGSFVLIDDLEVSEQTRASINPNAILGSILLEPLTLAGLPEIKKVYVFEAGSKGNRLIHQASNRLGISLPIVPGKYDVECKTVDGNRFMLSRNVEVRAQQVTPIRTDQQVAAVIVHDPKISGMELEAIYVLEAGGNRIFAKTKEFGRPMFVEPGTPYDIAIKQASGLARLKSGVVAKPGEIIEIP